MSLGRLGELDLSGKAVLVRTDFDDPNFLTASLPTLDYLAKRGAKVVVLSSQKNPNDPAHPPSMESSVQILAREWRRKLVIVPPEADRLPEYDIPHLFFLSGEPAGRSWNALLRRMRAGDAAVLENLFLNAEEAEGSEKFARKLAEIGDCFVHEAFSLCHEKFASIKVLPRLLPSAAGLHFERELARLSKIRDHPKHPIIILLGEVGPDNGELLENLMRFADVLLCGGKLANSFFKCLGLEIGKSETDELDPKMIAQIWRDHREKIRLPQDAIASPARSDEPFSIPAGECKPSLRIRDIGSQTILKYSEILRTGRTLIMSGTMGDTKAKRFSHGTIALARLLASRANPQIHALSGGAKMFPIFQDAGVLSFLSHFSSGDEAMLKFLARLPLPGIVALEQQNG